MTDYTLISFMEERLKATESGFRRYMFDKINWDSHMIGLTGPRGVGKTTMMLQYILSRRDEEKMLYVSADHMYFATHSLVELAEDFAREGGAWLCIDEVHKYPGWSRELKQVCDAFPRMRIAFTGSSVLDINKGEADLSRRALMYHMQGLSFREYLAMFHGISCSAVSFEDMLTSKIEIDGLEHPLPLFRSYLAQGYYPFAAEGDLEQRLMQVVERTVEGDIPLFADMKAATARKIKQLLGVISQLAPFKPNVENLSVELKVSKNNLPDYMTWLEKAGMIGQLRDNTAGLRGLGKIEKVYIDNPTLMSVLGGDSIDIGNLRETFFYNQMRVGHEVRASKKADFVVDGRTFEIGGRGKGFRQIEGVENAYVVRDDIEFAHGRVIPLFYFGLGY